MNNEQTSNSAETQQLNIAGVSHRFSLSEWLHSIEGTQKAKIFIISWIFAPMCLCMLSPIGWIFSDYLGLFFIGAAMFTFMILTGILLYWIIISD